MRATPGRWGSPAPFREQKKGAMRPHSHLVLATLHLVRPDFLSWLAVKIALDILEVCQMIFYIADIAPRI